MGNHSIPLYTNQWMAQSHSWPNMHRTCYTKALGHGLLKDLVFSLVHRIMVSYFRFIYMRVVSESQFITSSMDEENYIEY